MTQARLKKLTTYDPTTGIFTWNVGGNGRKLGGVVGSSKGSKYIRIRLDYKHYLAHRLAWLYMYGEFPTNCIDHINRDKTDNRICNLRDVTVQENGFNRGAKGYYYNKQEKKYKACIVIDGVQLYLGYHTTETEARDAYLKAKNKHHIIKDR